MMQFIGNVLTSHKVAANHPEASKEYFHITPDESQDLDATGLPVHLEHADNVKVGEVSRSWNDPDGTKWVLASIDTSTIEGKFVKNDLQSDKPLYSGLSLQHMYRRFADGSSSKTGIEVSICKDPRRPGCNIVHTTNDARYKVRASSNRSMTTEEVTQEKSTKDTTSTATDEVVAAVPVEASTPSTTQLMAEVVEASKQNAELQKQLDERNSELAALNEKAEKEHTAALQQKTQMVKELGDAVLEHVARLDPSLAGEDTNTAIATLREKYPNEVARVLEVACCASKHAKDLEEQLAKQKEESDRKLMEQAYHAAVSSRPGCHGTSEPAIAVQASKRARTEENPFAVQKSAPTSLYDPSTTMEQIREAYQGLRGRGSTTDAMRDIAGIVGQQREKGFR